MSSRVGGIPAPRKELRWEPHHSTMNASTSSQEMRQNLLAGFSEELQSREFGSSRRRKPWFFAGKKPWSFRGKKAAGKVVAPISAASAHG